MTAAADSLGERAGVAGPQLHHQVMLHAFHLLRRRLSRLLRLHRQLQRQMVY